MDHCHLVKCVALTLSPDGPGKPAEPLAPGIPCKHRTAQTLVY